MLRETLEGVALEAPPWVQRRVGALPSAQAADATKNAAKNAAAAAAVVASASGANANRASNDAKAGENRAASRASKDGATRPVLAQ